MFSDSLFASSSSSTPNKPRNTFKLPVPIVPLLELIPLSPIAIPDIEPPLSDTATKTLIASLVETNNWMGVELIAYRNTSIASHRHQKSTNRRSLQQDNAWAEATQSYPVEWLTTLRAFKVEYENAKGQILNLGRTLAAETARANACEKEIKDAKAFTDKLMTRTVDAESIVLVQIKRVEKQLAQSRAEHTATIEKIAVLNQSLLDLATYTIKAESEVQALTAKLVEARSMQDLSKHALDRTLKRTPTVKLKDKYTEATAQTENLKMIAKEMQCLEMTVAQLRKENRAILERNNDNVGKEMMSKASQSEDGGDVLGYSDSSSNSSTMTLDEISRADEFETRFESQADNIAGSMSTQTETIETQTPEENEYQKEKLSMLERCEPTRQATSFSDSKVLTTLQTEHAKVTAEYTHYKKLATAAPKAMEYFQLRDSNEQLKRQLAEYQRKK